MATKRTQVHKRGEQFASRTSTIIWQEEPSKKNPYLATACRCHGYDIMELAEKRNFIEVLFLLFSGELPTKKQATLLESLFIALINPGPRHPATRAAMNAAVSRTNTAHLLPIGLSVISGEHLGAQEVTASMRFLCKNLNNAPALIAKESLDAETAKMEVPRSMPGFGSRFGGIDPLPREIADLMLNSGGAGDALAWGSRLAKTLESHNMGWLNTGVAAAAFTDLGFSPWAGGGLFQILSAPGILAHSLELANKPLTTMPFLDEDHYVIATDTRNG